MFVLRPRRQVSYPFRLQLDFPLMNSLPESDGFCLIPQVLEESECRELIGCLGTVGGAGRRGLLAVPQVAALALSERLMDLVRSHLPAEPVPVRAIYFDKSPDANWLVPWHQDLTLALRKQVGVPGFGPWSVKEGIPHVQPPVELLERMITVRLHLDAADESNGALRVLPGTNRLGRLSTEQIQELRNLRPEVWCRASAGDALLMRPLLMHASSRSTRPGHRRVLHLDYAGFSLPGGLEWPEQPVARPSRPWENAEQEALGQGRDGLATGF